MLSYVWCICWQADAAGGDSSSCQTTLLRYILRVKPQRWLPVRFVEGRIAKDVEANLKAIRAVAERRAAANA